MEIFAQTGRARESKRNGARVVSLSSSIRFHAYRRSIVQLSFPVHSSISYYFSNISRVNFRGDVLNRRANERVSFSLKKKKKKKLPN